MSPAGEFEQASGGLVRRDFLKAAASTAAIGWAASSVHGQGVHSQGDPTLRIGLVGAGGRGTGAAVDALQADSNTKLVAIADIFRERGEFARSNLLRNKDLAGRIDLPDERLFSDFDGYRKLIDSDVDVVLLATPPHFRPDQLEYAVEKGKHVFVEKPVAVDAVGYHRVKKICDRARDKALSIVSGLCYRYDDAVVETVKRIRDGAIGEILAIQSQYDTGTLWHRGDDPNWSRMEYQIRNWLYYTWLSGDHIVEQAVHSLDKTAWLLGDIHPARAVGTGGRQQRVEPQFGHIYDHHTVFFEYPNGVRVYFTCRQQARCTNFVDEHVIGTEGTAQILAHRIQSRKTGDWNYDGPSCNMYQSEQAAFFRSIREGTPINNGDYMCNSTMIAIMGRMCTYSGQALTWEECLADPTRLGPGKYQWGPVEEPPVAIPGSGPLVS